MNIENENQYIAFDVGDTQYMKDSGFAQGTPLKDNSILVTNNSEDGQGYSLDLRLPAGAQESHFPYYPLCSKKQILAYGLYNPLEDE